MQKAVIFSVVFVSVFFSCKKHKITDESNLANEEKVVTEAITEACFMGILKKDTIMLTINQNSDAVITGKLAYNFFEKDKNDGTFSGKMNGDTLFATYKFMSEGVTLNREVAFLKKGDTFTEGFGAIVDDNKGNIIFKDAKKLDFSDNTILSKVACKK